MKKDKNGQEYFWGFTIVILRVSDIFSNSIRALSNFGYEYRLSKTEAPWSSAYKVVYQSDGQMTLPASYNFTIKMYMNTFRVHLSYTFIAFSHIRGIVHVY